jgi:hypothetical protein
MPNINPCSGCPLYGKKRYVCRVIVEKNLKCPCMDCLVKSICTIYCDERYKFGEHIYGAAWKGKKKLRRNNE